MMSESGDDTDDDDNPYLVERLVPVCHISRPSNAAAAASTTTMMI